MSGRELRPVFGGTATIYCIHDRIKREVVTESHVAKIGLAAGHLYDPKQHKIHLCSCCENLFVDPADIPVYCPTCSKAPVHNVGGPIAEPKGVVYE